MRRPTGWCGSTWSESLPRTPSRCRRCSWQWSQRQIRIGRLTQHLGATGWGASKKPCAEHHCLASRARNPNALICRDECTRAATTNHLLRFVLEEALGRSGGSIPRSGFGVPLGAALDHLPTVLSAVWNEEFGCPRGPGTWGRQSDKPSGRPMLLPRILSERGGSQNRLGRKNPQDRPGPALTHIWTMPQPHTGPVGTTAIRSRVIPRRDGGHRGRGAIAPVARVATSRRFTGPPRWGNRPPSSGAT